MDTRIDTLFSGGANGRITLLQVTVDWLIISLNINLPPLN